MSMMIIFGDEVFGVFSDKKQHIVALKTLRQGTDATRRIADVVVPKSEDKFLCCHVSFKEKVFSSIFSNACIHSYVDTITFD